MRTHPLALALLVTGCATSLGELRESAPVLSTVVAGDYRALALCTLDGANSLPRSRFIAHAGNAVYQLVDYRPATRIAVIGFSSGSADVELLFTPENTAAARVEIRFGFSDEISRRRYERELSGVVESCAGRIPKQGSGGQPARLTCSG